MIAGDLGTRAEESLAACGIEVFSGVSGNAGEALRSLAEGRGQGRAVPLHQDGAISRAPRRASAIGT